MHDVFLSYKHLDDTGHLTEDAALARKIFEFLTQQGVKVFFSHVALEELGVSAYKAAIDQALDRARILIAIGTSVRNLSAEWVRYEWDGFYNDIISGVKPDGRVFVYVDGISPKKLPRALRQSQVFTNTASDLARLATFVSNAIARINIADDLPNSPLVCATNASGKPKFVEDTHVCNKPTTTLASTRTSPLSIFTVDQLNHWPYEGIESRLVDDPDARIALRTNLQSGTTYRCMPGGAHQSIDWGLLSHNFNGGITEDAIGSPLLSTDVSPPSELWIQVEYRLFHSTRRQDDICIAAFRSSLMTGVYPPVPLWGKEESAPARIGSMDDPLWQWYEMGQAPSAPTTFVFASSVSRFQYINAHTIPAGADYQLVVASVVDLRAYREPPHYRDLLANFDALNEWYVKHGGQSPRI